MEKRFCRIDSTPVIRIAEMKRKSTIDPVLFGQLIAKTRKAKNMRQGELGRVVFHDRNIGEAAMQSRISRLECGKITLDDYVINRVASVLEIPLSIVHNQCHHGNSHSKSAKHNACFDSNFIELFPSVASYVQIINEAIQCGDREAAVIAFNQMCDAVRRRYKLLDPPPIIGDRKQKD
jgi:transcriptional regulator with XRE-family HTH domain